MSPALISVIWARTASTAPRVANIAAPPMRAMAATTRPRQPQQPSPIQNTGERPFLGGSGGAAIGGTGEAGALLPGAGRDRGGAGGPRPARVGGRWGGGG